MRSPGRGGSRGYHGNTQRAVGGGRAALAVRSEPVSDESLVEIVRGRLEGLGPVTASAMAESLRAACIAGSTSHCAALEAEGFAMRGRFGAAPGADSGEEEWCERRLLARIHRYTVKRLRAEIEPVQAREFVRFLCEWQRVLPESRMQGSDALAAVLTQLEGFEAPAGAWETEIIPSRMAEYEPQWLDEHCRAGRVIWSAARPARTGPAGGGTSRNAAAAHRPSVPPPSPCWRGATCRCGRR